MSHSVISSIWYMQKIELIWLSISGVICTSYKPLVYTDYCENNVDDTSEILTVYHISGFIGKSNIW